MGKKKQEKRREPSEQCHNNGSYANQQIRIQNTFHIPFAYSRSLGLICVGSPILWQDVYIFYSLQWIYCIEAAKIIILLSITILYCFHLNLGDSVCFITRWHFILFPTVDEKQWTGSGMQRQSSGLISHLCFAHLVHFVSCFLFYLLILLLYLGHIYTFCAHNDCIQLYFTKQLRWNTYLYTNPRWMDVWNKLKENANKIKPIFHSIYLKNLFLENRTSKCLPLAVTVSLRFHVSIPYK